MSCYLLIEIERGKYLYFYRKHNGMFYDVGEDLLHMAELVGTIYADSGEIPWLSFAKLLSCYPGFVNIPDGKIEYPADCVYIISTVRSNGVSMGTPELFVYEVDKSRCESEGEIIGDINNAIMNCREEFQHYVFGDIEVTVDYDRIGD